MNPPTLATADDMKAARAFVVDIIDSPTPEYRDEVERDLAAAFAAERARGAADELAAMADRLMRAHDVGPARRCRNRAAALRAEAPQ